MPTVLGVFDAPGDVAGVATKLRNRGYEDLEVYSPAPFEEIEEALDEKPSGVRIYTLIGGLIGVVTGFFITIWMSNDWQIIVGGKPFASIPPYIIIAFELTILFGGLGTVLGMFIVGGLPKGALGTHDAGYDARFSAEEFGLVVTCGERDVAEIDSLLRAFSATEVSLVAE
ncbi:MAG: DUF3341 domain-containing protein [Deltaproteobacteria bacterium]|nr:DUF3341 domain-containing protein [Deltaproteobacteria bacterium]MBW2448589.1 DUF3341 domain-containing protein [Deltaproteobacteria bacterium]